MSSDVEREPGCIVTVTHALDGVCFSGYKLLRHV